MAPGGDGLVPWTVFFWGQETRKITVGFDLVERVLEDLFDDAGVDKCVEGKVEAEKADSSAVSGVEAHVLEKAGEVFIGGREVYIEESS
jgi:hypothetical protein